ncbi:peptidase [Fragilaria crotonensis]|nr:peptidase [Fragilaria crotonensis]
MMVQQTILTILMLCAAASAVRIHNMDLDEEPLERRLLRRRLDQSNSNSPESHRVQSLPLLDNLPFDLYSGLLKASEDGDKKFFYWLVAPEEPAAKVSPDTPLLIWLNGGPGCSSSDGFFLENGPVRFEKQTDGQWKLVQNPFSWHLAPAWVLYIDQPVGTGLSVTHSQNYPKDDTEVNVDFHFFLEEFLLFYGDFFLQENRLSSRNPIFFSGESHGGHYIPSMMDYILSNPVPSRIQISFGGAAIGNGWIDPFNQYAAAEQAYGMGLINMAQKAHLDEQEKECQRNLSNQVFNSPICFALLDTIVEQSHGANAPTHVSMYDGTRVERKGSARIFPKYHDLVESYLGSRTATSGTIQVDYQEVMRAIHATETIEVNQQYKECADPPYEALKHQDGLGVVPQIARLLENNVRLIFYNGMNDLVCNHIGTEKTLMKLPWSQAADWSMAPRFTWNLETGSTPAAYVHEYKNLVYLKIPNAGHMVPQDQPEVSLKMIQKMLRGESFKLYPQYLDRTNPAETSC